MRTVRDLPAVAKIRRVKIRGGSQVGRRGRSFEEIQLTFVKDFNRGRKAAAFDCLKMMDQLLRSFSAMMTMTTEQLRWVGVCRT